MRRPHHQPGSPLPEGARFAEDTFTSAHGSRRFMTYLPASAAQGLQGIVMMLHGCTQTPQDFATGTRMNDLAETHRLIVIYPQQSRGENAQTCWNWFRRGDQMRDRGEPALLAALAHSVATRHAIPRGRIFVAGLSAGGAMAAILGETHPDVFAAVGVHSGLPVGSAKDVGSAFAAMAGNGLDRAAGQEPGRTAAVPTIVLHGAADTTVHPGNGRAVARQVLRHAPRETLQTEARGEAGGLGYLRRVTTGAAGAVLLEEWEIDGLGHAWSGGDPLGSYAEASGPDASAAMVRFFLAPATGL